MLKEHPSHVVQEQANLRVLTGECAALIKDAQRAGHEAIEKFRLAGNRLLLLKEEIDHGKWEGFLKHRLGFEARTARRWMALAKADPATDLVERWRIVNGNVDAEEASEGQANGTEEGDHKPSGKKKSKKNRGKQQNGRNVRFATACEGHQKTGPDLYCEECKRVQLELETKRAAWKLNWLSEAVDLLHKQITWMADSFGKVNAIEVVGLKRQIEEIESEAAKLYRYWKKNQ